MTTVQFPILATNYTAVLHDEPLFHWILCSVTLLDSKSGKRLNSSSAGGLRSSRCHDSQYLSVVQSCTLYIVLHVPAKCRACTGGLA